MSLFSPKSNVNLNYLRMFIFLSIIWNCRIVIASVAVDSCSKILSPEYLAGAHFIASRYEGLASSSELLEASELFEVNHNKDLEKSTYRVAKWLQKFEILIENPNQENLSKLKAWLYDLYVTKKRDIPQSYFDKQIQLARELGKGFENITEENKNKIAETIIKNQEASLDLWINYLTAPDTAKIYPVWIKLWTFMEVGKLGKFNPTQGSFNGRPHGTVELFPELNQEAYAKFIDLVIRHVNKQKLPESADPELLSLLKKKKFGNMYGKSLKLSIIDSEDMEIVTGKWVKFEKGSDHMPLINSLLGKATGWCTAGEYVAKSQIQNGDFYIYYSNDKSGRPSNPRIAIRMEGQRIAEIRGVGKDQHLDNKIATTDILKDKLKEFGFEGELYRDRTEDMKTLTEIENKMSANLILSREELRFLYEIEKKIKGFGYKKDPRIEELKSIRNQIADYATIFNIDPLEITQDKQKVLTGEAKIFIGDFVLMPNDNLSNISLIVVTGNADFRKLTSAKNLSLIEYIGGNVDFRGLTDASGLSSLKYIGGDADFRILQDASGLSSLKYIGGSVDFRGLRNAKGLSVLSNIERTALFNNLIDASHLVSLSFIGGIADFGSLTNAHGLSSLAYIGGNADFRVLQDASGLSSLSHIVGFAGFLKLPKDKFPSSLSYIGGMQFYLIQ